MATPCRPTPDSAPVRFSAFLADEREAGVERCDDGRVRADTIADRQVFRRTRHARR